MISDAQLKEIVQEYGSPLYLFDGEELQERVCGIKEKLGEGIALCYAMKANPFLISYLDAYVDKFEVCSPGEYEICQKENICPDKIVLSGVYKRSGDAERSLADGFGGVYTIESRKQFTDLYGLVRTSNQKVKILPRLTSGNQFGMDETELIEMLSDTEKMSCFELSGIHYFSGTQKKNRELIKKELHELDGFCQRVYQQTGRRIEEIEYGPGLLVDYFGSQVSDYSEVEYLGELLQEKKQYKYTIELGRYIAASCGVYLTRVVDVKQNRGKGYCIVDGGIHHVTYYGQMPGLRVPTVRLLSQGDGEDGTRGKWTVCGALCTVHDVLLRDYEMKSPDIGDMFVFQNTGAYSVTETGSLFLSRELPAVLFMDKNKTVEVLRERMSSAGLTSRNRRNG